jgi:hypothetical protein
MGNGDCYHIVVDKSTVGAVVNVMFSGKEKTEDVLP